MQKSETKPLTDVRTWNEALSEHLRYDTISTERVEILAGLEMVTASVHQLLQKEVQTLPEDLVVEVLDFVQFLKSRRDEEAFLWEQVEATQAYRRRHPESVTTMTADEWLEMTADLDDEG